MARNDGQGLLPRNQGLRKGSGFWWVGLGLLAALSSAQAGPVLDEILNCLHLDQQTSPRDENRFCTVEPGIPIGQTFVVGEEVEEIFRIALWQAFWHDTWQPDEALVLTLWDSPEKRTAYGRCAIPYARRMWEGGIPLFTLEARVLPSRSYYFELTVEVEPLRPAVTPEEWLLSGRRPPAAGGDGRLHGIGTAREDYPQGQAYVGGQPQDFDLWFEVHVRRSLDREALLREALERFNLDYPPLAPVRQAVQEGSWDRALDELIRHFESREDLFPPDRRHPHLDPTFDTREADLACEQKIRLEDGTLVSLEPHWNHFALWPERGGVGLTRSGLRKALSAAYFRTGHEKYAKAFNDLLMQVFIHCPSPLRAGVFKAEETIPAALPPGLAGGSMWSGLSLGARMGHGFYYYAPFVHSPFFFRDVRAAFIINLGEMAEVLERMQGSGNWEAQMAEALFDFGLTYPEFQGAPRWVQQGFDTLVANALSTVYPDGVLQEPSMGYHSLVMNRYSHVMERSGTLALKVPDEMAHLTEKMFEFVMYSTLPDGTLPAWGDANSPLRPELLERGARLFGRKDFLFVGTQGRQGTPPAKVSAAFPQGGYYYMRSGWTPEAHYLGLHCGPYGSHGHRDTLGVVVAAFGQTLLIDPGVSTYGTPESRKLSSTLSHNTVTVAGRDANPGRAEAWVSTPGFDFFAGHNEGYQGLPQVRHYRRIWFLKPRAGFSGLWLVLDDVRGEGSQEVQLRYRFAPLPLEQDPAAREVWTSTPAGNLLVGILEKQARLEVGQDIAVWEKLTSVPVATFAQEGPLPLAFTSWLVPFRGPAPPSRPGRKDAVQAGGGGDWAAAQPFIFSAQEVEVQPRHLGVRAVRLTHGSADLLVVVNRLEALQEEPACLSLDWRGSPLILDGAGLVLRWEREGNALHLTALQGVRLRRVTWGDQELFSAADFQEAVDKEW